MRDILFDLDGVLVDSRAWHLLTLEMAMHEAGYLDFRAVEGARSVDQIRSHIVALQQRPQGLTAHEQDPLAIYQRKWYFLRAMTLSGAAGRAYMPPHKTIGQQIVERARVYAGRVGVVTDTLEHAAAPMLLALGIAVDDLFARETIEEPGKPDPHLYARATARGYLHGDTVVFEDSERGAAAARSVGYTDIVQVPDVGETLPLVNGLRWRT